MTIKELEEAKVWRDFFYHEWQSSSDQLERGKWRARYLKEDQLIKDHEQQQGQDHR